jgi:hypothetical protein
MKRTYDFYFKWAATITLIVGISINSFGIYPLGPIVLMCGGLLWLTVGIIWKDGALITTNGVATVVSFAGLVYNFLL